MLQQDSDSKCSFEDFVVVNGNVADPSGRAV
jgi:hypothetical protein